MKAAKAGSTTLTLWLTNPGGTPLPGSTATVTVEATHFGTMAIVIIGIALAVFVITAIGRAIRRGIRQPGGGDEGGPDETAAADGDEEAVLAKDGPADTERPRMGRPRMGRPERAQASRIWTTPGRKPIPSSQSG